MERQPSGTRKIDKFSEISSANKLVSRSWAGDSGSGAAKEPLLAGGGALKSDEKHNGSKGRPHRRSRMRSAWYCGLPVLIATLLSTVIVGTIVQSFVYRQGDTKGCRMSYMWPQYARLDEFDTEHTRFASKYSLYLYREGNLDDTSRQASVRPRGVPVLFIPGNAGSYKQVRTIASEAARYFHDQVKANQSIFETGARPLDFFAADFNEDVTAFHGQTLLDQAEYLNEAIVYILSLYHEGRKTSVDSSLPDPTSVIILGHSMGGVVARTMLTMLNYQANSINTIITLSTPHARPPITVDADIVKTYERINNYWRTSYSTKWDSHNPLSDVIMISISGGSLDTIVPSDYMSVSSLVPETHGFTVFTSTVPECWTGMDHLAILWCGQLRNAVAHALLEIVDVTRPGQTKNRAERMKIFKRGLLTGMESIVEKSIVEGPLTSLLALESESHSMIPLGESLELHSLGKNHASWIYLMPVPSRNGPEGSVRFTLLTDQNLKSTKRDPKLEVLVCSTFPLQAGRASALLAMDVEPSEDTSGTSRLACKNAAQDVIILPASTQRSRHPFDDGIQPFSYLQYNLEDIADHEFVAIVDKSTRLRQGWVVAQFSERSQFETSANASFSSLLTNGVEVLLPVERPIVTELLVPNMKSSMLAYKLSISVQSCKDSSQLFTPLVRQYISDPYESKYFVNVHEADINLHGVAPYMPGPLHESDRGLSIQLWSDPTCKSPIDITLKIDILGSLGKLVMRYRTIVAAFPLFIVALVIRRQFYEYDVFGYFIPFNEALELVLIETIPTVLAVVSGLSFTLSFASSTTPDGMFSFLWHRTKMTPDTQPLFDALKNDILIGSVDPFFWFLAPLFILVSVGICASVNYVALFLVQLLTGVYTCLSGLTERRRTAPVFSTTSPRKRLVTTIILLLSVATVIPYQFAYVVSCVVQLFVCIKALKFARETGYATRSNINWDFVNYTHSMFLLMLWILPINMSVLVVWVHSLTVKLTPFASHHNVLSVVPFILLVETLTSGSMIPRCDNGLRHLTSVLFLFLGGYAVIYGVMYAYFLHHIANTIAAWLVVLHFSTSGFSVSYLTELWYEPEEPKKIP